MELKPSATQTSHIFLLLFTSIALLARIESVGYVAGNLMAEDGPIFVSQSYELGIRSLWMEYYGYLFTYQRIVALFATQLPPGATPHIFAAAWLLSFFSILWVLKVRQGISGLNGHLVLLLLCAIALQPNRAASFFFLYSAHCNLGISLAFLICIPSEKTISPLEALFLILASLSGAFSIFLTAVLALQLAILRDFSIRKVTYILVTACAIIQAISILASPRFSQASPDGDAMHWMQFISSFFLFGMNSKLIYMAAVMFWSITFVFFCKWIADKGAHQNTTLWLSPLFSSLTAISILIASALSVGDILANLSPLDAYHWHFLVPYSLVFYIAITCTRDHMAWHITTAVLIGVICLAGLIAVARIDEETAKLWKIPRNIQWAAYTEFQKIEPNVLIPVYPSLPVYPPLWHAKLKSSVGDNSVSLAVRRPTILVPLSGVSEEIDPATDSKPSTSAAATGRTLRFDIKDRCATSAYLALEVDVWRSKMGWARVSWGRPGSFNDERSLRRFYPEGSALMQFAFRRDLADYMVRLDLTEGVDESESRMVKNLLLGTSGTTVGVPTAPGGETMINEVRLFCL